MTLKGISVESVRLTVFCQNLADLASGYATHVIGNYSIIGSSRGICQNLTLADIPQQLGCLNSLEKHLIAINIPFVKMILLPRGGQHGVRGPIVCVPSNIQDTVKALPRSRNEDQMIRVKLKRSLLTVDIISVGPCYKKHTNSFKVVR